MSDRIAAGARILGVGIVSALIIVTLVQHEVHLWGLARLRSAADIVHVSRWISWTSGAMTIAFAVATCRIVARRIVFLTACMLSLAVYGLSVRSLEVNGVSGEITEFWVGKVVRRDLLIHRDDVPYCFDVGMFIIKVRSVQGGATFSYFRGVWPATFSGGGLGRAFATVQSCA